MQNRCNLSAKAAIPLLLISFFFMVVACNSSKSIESRSSSFDAFSTQFPRLSLPYTYNEDSLQSSDTAAVMLKGPKLFKIVPDSILFLHGDSSTAAYALGKGRSEDGERKWFFIKSVGKTERCVHVLVFNDKDSLLDTKKIADIHKKTAPTLTFQWKKNHLLNLYRKTALGNGYVSYKRDVYGLMGSGKLQLILTNKENPLK